MRALKHLMDFALSYLVPGYRYDYWHFPHYHSPRIHRGDYFIDFTPKLAFSGPRDGGGVPLLDLSTVPSARSDLVVYSSILVSQYALGFYSSYLEAGDSALLEQFLRMADSLLDHLERSQRRGRTVAICSISFGRGATSSAMAQGQAISVWCRAFRETGEERFLEGALEAFHAFTLSLEEGGVVSAGPGFPVLEEWADEPFHILNGHLFAFVGIHELSSALPPGRPESGEVAKLRDLYLEASLEFIRKVDMKFWTRYSLRPGPLPNIASYFYQHLHVEMLKGLHLLTGASPFEGYSRRWTRQMGNPFFRCGAMLLKLAEKAGEEVSYRLRRARRAVEGHGG